MPRRRLFKKRTVNSDMIYQSQLVAKFINMVMRCGKKSVAERIVYTTLQETEKRTKQGAIEILRRAINNVKPRVAVKSRRIGGATYQVPVEIHEDRSMSLALRWIVHYAKLQKGKSMIEKLTQELLNASNNTGAAVKKREDTHKMADANKAFAHYRF